ncbi:hypothetical protein ACFV3R_20675 [Streptomyces sp. NPDC059740]|uniref:hypothetical protein n=1 Tax=Streptomyces sp. NPDC059740 TaxID=3346926 RepID=UPI00364D9646
MRLHLDENFSSQVEDQRALQMPNFSLGDLSISARRATDPEGRDTQSNDTFGSTDWLWSGDDEFRFSMDDKRLLRLRLSIPEEQASHCTRDALTTWRSAPIMSGSLVADSIEDFRCPPTTIHTITPLGDYLVCTQGGEAPQSGSLRLNVAHNLDLLFRDAQLYGWAVHNPASLLGCHETTTPTELDGRTLARFMQLTTGKPFERVQEGHESARKELRDFHAATDSSTSELVKMIHARVGEICEDWCFDDENRT